MNKLEKRITEISYKLGLSHLSAYYTALPIIESIFKIKKKDEPIILSQGHCFCALAVVLEKYYKVNAYKMVKKYMTHPTRNKREYIDLSTGSLGQGMTIAVGMALADRKKNVYVITSDGEMSEGSCWEALMIASELKLNNMKVYVNANGFSCYKKVNLKTLEKRIKTFFPVKFINTNMDKYPKWLWDIDGHYSIINSKERLQEMFHVK